MALSLLSSGPSDAPAAFLFAHGAGAPEDSPFMEAIAEGLADRGWRVHRFAFPYMRRSRETGRRCPPDRAPVLQQCFRDVVAQIEGGAPLFIGGKSMGGRMASLILNELALAGRVRGGLCFGYPFHPLGKPLQLRIDHLQQFQLPCLILQGERDPMGRAEDVAGYGLTAPLQVAWIPDGDHSFKPRKRSGRTESMNWQLAVDLADQFMREKLA